MRHPGFSRWMRRIAARASASAAAVTVQVLSTTSSASVAELTASKPRWARLRSMAAPSACVARHPKFCTKNFTGVTLDYKEPKAFSELVRPFSAQGGGRTRQAGETPDFQVKALTNKYKYSALIFFIQILMKTPMQTSII